MCKNNQSIIFNPILWKTKMVWLPSIVLKASVDHRRATVPAAEGTVHTRCVQMVPYPSFSNLHKQTHANHGSLSHSAANEVRLRPLPHEPVWCGPQWEGLLYHKHETLAGIVWPALHTDMKRKCDFWSRLMLIFVLTVATPRHQNRYCRKHMYYYSPIKS